MGRAAHRRALDGGAGGIHRVYFHYPAKTVGLVGVFHRIESSVELVPTVRPVLAGAPSFLVVVDLVAVAKIGHPVLFARKVGPPRCLAAGTVVERAQYGAPCGVGSGFHHCVTGSRALYRERRVHGETAGKAGGPNHLPVAALEFDLIHRQTMRVLGLLDFFGVHIVEATDMQQAVIGVLMVDGNQATA